MNKDQKHPMPSFEHLKNAKEASTPVSVVTESPEAKAKAHEKAKTDKPKHV